MPLWSNRFGTEGLIAHAKEHQKGIIQRKSQLNRPPWLDWVKFRDDQLEEQFNFTLSNLDGFH